MENVTNISIGPLTESKYLKPFRFNYTQNGVKKNWDLIEAHDSIAILIFNITRQKFVFVKQFRPTVYFNSVTKGENVIDTTKYPPSLGVTLELCAGIIDKDKSVEQIAVEEVFEECGYEVPISSLEKIYSFRSDTGAEGPVQMLYYCEVTDNMKVSKGGGIDNEMIDVVEMSIEEVESIITSPPKTPLPSPPAFFFALTWFLHFKAKNFR